jgi:tetratricopeptide (TPR) repeat protein
MVRDTRFWIAAAAFQLVFGLAVFALTRYYYVSGRDIVRPEVAGVLKSLPKWPDGPAGMPAAPSLPAPMANLDPAGTDPATIARNADESFNSGQYARAAELYQQLLMLDPTNVELHNNVGLTLHYLGRSAEALEVLQAGTALDPTHQRSWLTTGFVNAQLGNGPAAREALGRAQVGADEEIRKAAREMLAALP